MAFSRMRNKICSITLTYGRIAAISASYRKSGWVEEHDHDVRFKSGSGNMALSLMRNASAIIIGTVRSLWNWQLGRYRVPQNVFLVYIYG